MTKRVTSNQIEKSISDDRIQLVKYENGTGSYWYFIFDDGETFETESVYTPRLSDLSLEDWVSTGQTFLQEQTA